MNKHLPISKEMEAVMKKHLLAKCSEAEAERYWKKILAQYEAFLKDLSEFKKMAGIVNANKPLLRRILHLAFKMTAKTDEGREGGYIMKVEPYSRDGVRYRFDRCPIAEFAKTHGYLDIMPAFCNSDYPAMECINAALIRQHTCANSNVCDYWIVGDKSEAAKKHPKKTDEKGYWYNDLS